MKYNIIYLIFLIIFLFSCTRLYQGTIIEKGVESDYYTIDEHNHYDSYTICDTEYEDYVGTTFSEIYTPIQYYITVIGFDQKENKLTEKLYLTKEQYNNLKVKDFIIIRTKAKKWYELDKEYFSDSKVYSDKTIQEIKIKGSNEYNVRHEFETSYLHDWEALRVYERN